MDFQERIKELLGRLPQDGMTDEALVLRDLVAFVEEELVGLQEKNAQLEKEVGELQVQIKERPPREEFVKYGSVLRIKTVRYRYSDRYYCPVCRTEMGQERSSTSCPLVCPACKREEPFPFSMFRMKDED